MRHTRHLTMMMAAAALLVGILPAGAASLNALIADLRGNDEIARANARQQLVRESPTDAVPKLLPLFAGDNQGVWWAAYNVIADMVSEVSAPGREAERSIVAADLMALLAPGQSPDVKRRVLRLLPLAVPQGMDVGRMAALLSDPDLREKARAALEELGTTQARAALRAFLPKAEPAFQCAILNSLATLQDADSLDAARTLAVGDNAAVRQAALRAFAWQGDPADLPLARHVAETVDNATRADAWDGYLRLLNAMEVRGGNWQVTTAAYMDLLHAHDSTIVSAALAGLGRIGDGSCVAPVLETAGKAEGSTFLIAMAALRSMQGIDVTRELVAACPNQPAPVQLALIPVLGGKKHPMTTAILKQAAESGDAATRMAGLTAFADAALPESLDVLTRFAQQSSDQEKAAARPGLLQLASGLQTSHQMKEAGRAYALLFALAGDAERDLRSAAAKGLVACPAAEGYDAAKVLAADAASRDVAMRVLLGVAGALAEAKQNDRAIELYELLSRMSPPMEIMQAAAKGMAAAGAKVDLQGLLGTVTNWWVVGPFELGEQNKGWETAYIDEPNVNLAGRYMSGKRRIEWKSIVSKDPNGCIDLRVTIADRDLAIAYAYTEITVDAATDAVMLVGADDSERIWLNGEKVLDQFVARGLQPDQDRVPVKLKAGKNAVLLKVWQNNLQWKFCVRLTLPDGRPVQFTQKTP